MGRRLAQVGTTGSETLDASTACGSSLVRRCLPAFIDGLCFADNMCIDVRARAAAFESHAGRKACLATVLVGDDPASDTYVRMKTNRCRTTGLDSRSYRVAATARDVMTSAGIGASNLLFGRWGETFSDDFVAAAMIDRLVHHAEVLTLTGDSYRTRQRRQLLAKENRPADD